MPITASIPVGLVNAANAEADRAAIRADLDRCVAAQGAHASELARAQAAAQEATRAFGLCRARVEALEQRVAEIPALVQKAAYELVVRAAKGGLK